MGAIKLIFRAIGGLYLLAVVVIGVGGAWLTHGMRSVDAEIAADHEPRAARSNRASAWERERSSRSYVREEESEVRRAERESMGCDPTYSEC